MKTATISFLPSVLCLSLVCVPARANDSTFGGAGSDLVPLQEARMQMVREDIFRAEPNVHQRWVRSERLPVQEKEPPRVLLRRPVPLAEGANALESQRDLVRARSAAISQSSQVANATQGGPTTRRSTARCHRHRYESHPTGSIARSPQLALIAFHS